MSMVMFVIGCIAVMVGVAMVGFGIPVNEFSFGNTLIVSGTTLATGGLIVVALSAAVSQLHRIAEALAARPPAQPGRPAEAFQPPAEARTAPARVPFPPKPSTREPRPADLPLPADLDEGDHQSFTPALRNPEAPPVTVEDDVSLSPHYPMGAPADMGEPARPQPSSAGMAEPRAEPGFDAGWRSPPAPTAPREAPSSYFDTMWPAKPRTAPAAPARPKPDKPDKPDMRPREREAVAREQAPEPRTAAILKSGVVDGMGYTLYVDGSIEAELPQGTLRFASIDELRSHLEKNG